MQIDAERWKNLREAVETDDAERFCKLVGDFVHIVVHHEAARKKAADRARSLERGERPFFAWDR